MSRSLLWKIFITASASGATFTATTLTEQEVTWALMLSAFVGGVTLVVQFLLDVEARQISVEEKLQAYERSQQELTHGLEASVKTQLERFNQVNTLLARLDSSPLDRQPVIELVQHAAAIDRSVPALVHRLAESQISDLSQFLKDLGMGREVDADGDEWFWTFTLTANVQRSIEATSYMALGKDEQTLWDDDGWNSELGRRYLELQAQAVQRGVSVRRIFILETPRLADNRELRRMCDQQSSLGFEVRSIDAMAASRITEKHIPLMIFDRAISYELTPRRFTADSPGFVKTTMVLNPFKVVERLEMFQRLWSGAVKYEGG